MMNKQPIIDFHAHCFPDKLAPSALQALLSNAPSLSPYTDGTVAGVRESMRESGVTASVICSIATNPRQMTKVNDFAIATDNGGDIVHFGSVHPDAKNWKAELRRIKDAGLKGIKLHPEYQDFFVDDEKVLPIYDECARLGLVIVFHMGEDMGFDREMRATPKRIAHAMEYCDFSKNVLAHMGGYRCYEEAEEHLVGKPLYFDTAFVLPIMRRSQLLRMIENHGHDKILFATDSPWGDPRLFIETMEALPVTDAQRRDIMYGNAAKLLGL